MGLLELVFLLAFIGFVLYMVLHYVPMPDPVKTGIIVLAVIAVIFFVWNGMGRPDIRLR